MQCDMTVTNVQSNYVCRFDRTVMFMSKCGTVLMSRLNHEESSSGQVLKQYAADSIGWRCTSHMDHSGQPCLCLRKCQWSKLLLWDSLSGYKGPHHHLL